LVDRRVYIVACFFIVAFAALSWLLGAVSFLGLGLTRNRARGLECPSRPIFGDELVSVRGRHHVFALSVSAVLSNPNGRDLFALKIFLDPD
jgi:hypothetical protein